MSEIHADEKDLIALKRCYECADDGQDTDVGLPMLNRLIEIGWMERVGHEYWITPEGDTALEAEEPSL